MLRGLQKGPRVDASSCSLAHPKKEVAGVGSGVVAVSGKNAIQGLIDGTIDQRFHFKARIS